MKDNKPEYILVHCSAYPAMPQSDRLNTINAEHKSRGFDQSSLGYFVGYHVLLSGMKAHRTRVDSEHGDHCNDVNFAGKSGFLFSDQKSLNFHSLAICTDFNGDYEGPPAWALPFLKAQIIEWMRAYNIPIERVMFHRDFTNLKTCPGSTVTKAWLHDLLLSRPPTPAPPVLEPVETKEELAKHITLLQTVIRLLKELLKIKQNNLGASMNEFPAWYQSSAGPGLSATIMSIVGTFLPVLNLFFASKGLHLLPADVDPYVDALVFLVFSLIALVGYIRSKMVLQEKVRVLSSQVVTMGGTPHVRVT